MIIRSYSSEDCGELIALCRGTIHAINARDYNKSQIKAWAPNDMDIARWDKTLRANYAVVAEKGGVVVGFGDVDRTGYLERLYTHKDYQRMGIATLIADDIERFCICKGVQSITTAASITAKSFFEKRGYHVLKQQSVALRGQLFINFLMEKTLRK